MKRIIAILITVLLLAAAFPAFAETVLELKGSDSAGSDDVLSSDEVVPFDGGLINNGGFDDGEDGWTYYSYSGYGTMTVEETETGKCLHISLPDGDDARAQQTITVYPECYYSITAKVKTQGVTGGKGANISVDGYTDAFSDCLFGDNDRENLSLNVCTGLGMTSMTINLRLGGYAAESTGDVWFDDVRVEELSYAPAEYIQLGNVSGGEQQNDEDKKGGFTMLTIALAAASVLLVAGAVIYIIIAKKKRPAEQKPAAQQVTPKNAREREILLKPTDTSLHMKKADWIFLITLIIIYGVTALTNLGTTQAPVTEWVGASSSEPAVLSFDGAKTVKSIYVFGSILGEYNENGTIRIYDADDNEIAEYTEKYGDMFRWHNVYTSSSGMTTTGITVKATGIPVVFREIAILDGDNNLIRCTANESAAALCDEPDMVPSEFSCMNGMYFDELYHGRTAYEHLNNLKSYENSHPPLGKLLISVGIAIFGMNAFGWRVVGAVFGIMMLPVFYLLCKCIFKDRSTFAMVATTLFAFDFMHFVQTRIATIDVYGVFFVLLMFFFMYRYFTMSFYRDGLGKTLIPLGLAGIAFGLGAASKWICFYAGAGLALMLLISFIQRVIEWRRFKDSSIPEYRDAVRDCRKNIILTCLFCVGFFIIIPVIIYALSYLGYPDVKLAFTDTLKNGGNIFSASGAYLNKVWGYQEFMYNYHSSLTSTHTYQSTWLQWIFDLRPIWYAINYFPENHVTTISAFGNPIVWWLSFFGTVGMMVQLIRKKLALDAPVIMILVGIFSNLLPWVLVSRCVFIYHYFATVPFIIIAAMYLIKSIEDEHKWFAYFKYTWAGLALCLFALFYPILTGLKIHESYALNLEWFKSWWFVRNAPAPTDAGILNGVIIITIMVVIFVVLGFIFYDRHRKAGDKEKE